MTILKKYLAASAATLALVAGNSFAATDEAIAERIKPYGSVCLVGDECANAVAAAPAAAAAGGEEAAGGSQGEALFSAKTCVACHSVDNKVVGPAMKEVAAKYAGDADHIIASIKNGSQGNWGPIPMPPNAVNDEEAAALAEWILSLN